MKFALALIAILGASVLSPADAIDLKAMSKTQSTTKADTEVKDGPTNGEMADDEKDTLIQVLCPGTI